MLIKARSASLRFSFVLISNCKGDETNVEDSIVVAILSDQSTNNSVMSAVHIPGRWNGEGMMLEKSRSDVLGLMMAGGQIASAN